MYSIRGSRSRQGGSPQAIQGKFIWLHRFGYVRIRDLVRIGTVLYVLLTALITVFTSDLITVLFLVCTAILALKFASIERPLVADRRVNIYTEGGLYIAEHLGTGMTRHGERPEEALASLAYVFDRRQTDQTPS